MSLLLLCPLDVERGGGEGRRREWRRESRRMREGSKSKKEEEGKEERRRKRREGGEEDEPGEKSIHFFCEVTKQYTNYRLTCLFAKTISNAFLNSSSWEEGRNIPQVPVTRFHTSLAAPQRHHNGNRCGID